MSNKGDFSYKEVVETISLISETLGLKTPTFCHDDPTCQPITAKEVLQGRAATLLVGDNMEWLKALARSQSHIFDLCYADPPYNTKSKMVYEDNRSGRAYGVFGKHSSWMAFMLPRLVLAHALLKRDGVMAVSIDDYEYAHLKILLNAVFGEQNFMGTVVVQRSKNGKGAKKNLASTHEYLLLYGKTKWAALRGEPDTTSYDKKDEFGRFKLGGVLRKKGGESLKKDRPNMNYPLYVKKGSNRVTTEKKKGWQEVYPIDSNGVHRRWIWGRDKAKKEQHKLYASESGVIYVKNYSQGQNGEKRTKVRTVWDDNEFSTTSATNELKAIFGVKVFDTPKPVAFLKKVVEISISEGVVLDMFSGSGAMAEAVHAAGKDDKGVRQVIMMESDTRISNTHVAKELGYHSINEITERRLRHIQMMDTDRSFRFSSKKLKC